MQEYEKALKYAKAIQQVEPGNHQAKELANYIEKKMKRGTSVMKCNLLSALWTYLYIECQQISAGVGGYSGGFNTLFQILIEVLLPI